MYEIDRFLTRNVCMLPLFGTDVGRIKEKMFGAWVVTWCRMTCEGEESRVIGSYGECSFTSHLGDQICPLYKAEHNPPMRLKAWVIIPQLSSDTFPHRFKERTILHQRPLDVLWGFREIIRENNLACWNSHKEYNTEQSSVLQRALTAAGSLECLSPVSCEQWTYQNRNRLWISLLWSKGNLFSGTSRFN